MRRLMILVAALALLLTACKIEVNANFTINADKSGSVVMEIGFDDEVQEFAQSQGSDPTEMFADFDLESVPGATVSEERRGDMNFYIVTVPIDDLTAADGLGGEMAQGLTDSFDITFTEDRVIVEGTTALDDALGDSGEDTAALPMDMLADIFSINVRITMPGKILDNNATSVDGNTLTWSVDLASPTLDIYAESNPNESAGGGSMTMILIIAGAVIVAALLLWLWSRSRSGGSGAAAATATPAAPAGDTPPPPPPSE